MTARELRGTAGAHWNKWVLCLRLRTRYTPLRTGTIRSAQGCEHKSFLFSCIEHHRCLALRTRSCAYFIFSQVAAPAQMQRDFAFINRLPNSWFRRYTFYALVEYLCIFASRPSTIPFHTLISFHFILSLTLEGLLPS